MKCLSFKQDLVVSLSLSVRAGVTSLPAFKDMSGVYYFFKMKHYLHCRRARL